MVVVISRLECGGGLREMATGGVNGDLNNPERQWQIGMKEEWGEKRELGKEAAAGWRRQSGSTVWPVVVVVTGHLRQRPAPVLQE